MDSMANLLISSNAHYVHLGRDNKTNSHSAVAKWLNPQHSTNINTSSTNTNTETHGINNGIRS